MFRSPPYIYLRRSGFYFCLNIPFSLRDTVTSRQFRYPLRTHSRAQAKLQAAYVSYWCRILFIRIRSGAMKTLTDRGIKRLVQQWLQESLDMTEEARRTYPENALRRIMVQASLSRPRKLAA